MIQRHQEYKSPSGITYKIHDAYIQEGRREYLAVSKSTGQAKWFTEEKLLTEFTLIDEKRNV